jgi:hypothetical protein
VVFCRAGEKRSVGFASFVAAMLKDVGVRCRTEHLSQYYWSYKTCAGNCNECGDPQALQVIYERAMQATGWRRTLGERGNVT